MKALKDTRVSSKRLAYQEFVKRKIAGLKTGIKDLDDYLQGLGGFVNIQGETSSCKSALGLQIIHYNLRKGTPCIMIDKENGDGRVISRLLCQSGRVSDTQLRTMSDNQRDALAAEVFKMDLHLHTEPVDSTDMLMSRIAECWELYKRPFILFVDSIQAMDRLADDQRVSLEQWVYFLDRLKVEYAGKLTVLITSEKNRVSYGQQGVGGGKGSNVLDYKPETVLDIKWNEGEDSFTVKVSKHRDGMRGGTVDLQKVFSQTNDPRSFTFLLEEFRGDLP